MFELVDVKGQSAKIKVVGVGGAGGNVINNMVASRISEVDFIAVNTDAQVLDTSLATTKLQIGSTVTRGLGAGSKPELGRQAAEEDREHLFEALEGTDMVFITAGMGGGTGTGASPIVAEVAKEVGALTVGIVTKPFFYEGRMRLANAEAGIKELERRVDTLIVIPNDRIGLVVAKGTSLLESFAIANDVLRQAVQGISDLILVPGLINLDFADIKTIMEGAGRSVMGMGYAKGEGSSKEAAKKAISNPLLENSSIEGAKGIIINITGGLELSLADIEEATGLVHDFADENANIIVGAVIDPDIREEVRVTVIATGFTPKKEPIELPKVKKWSPGPVTLRGSERVLAKSLKTGMAADKASAGAVHYEDPFDIPAFLRRPSPKEI
jgi:cell division protein FtsZ